MRNSINISKKCFLFFIGSIFILTLGSGFILFNSGVAFADSDTSFNSSSSAMSAKDAYIEEENIELFNEVMDIIDSEMKANDTTVIEQLQKQLENYESILASGLYNNRESIEIMIKTNKEMINSYMEYNVAKTLRKAYHPLYSPVLAAAKTYFDIRDYYLATELLTYAWDNETPNKLYKVEHTNIIASGTKFKEISKGTSTKGSATFDRNGNRTDDDLFFAIRVFDYEKKTPNARAVLIHDTYDFDYIENATSEIDKILNICHEAQNAGVVVPFLIHQTINPTDFVILQPNYIYQENFDIPTISTRNYIVVVSSSNKLKISTSREYGIMISIHHFSWEDPKYISATADNETIEIPYAEGLPTTLSISIRNLNIFKTNNITINISC